MTVCLQCGTENPAQGGLTVAGAVVALVLGRAFASYRAWREVPTETRRPRLTAKVVQGMVAVFFLVVLLVLVYETAGLLGLGGLEPITSYVRCARTHDAGWTAAAAAAVAFLAGHWLWFPVPRSPAGQEEAPA